MARKTFSLELKSVEVKTLEELREHFDLEKIVEYFKSGELVEWLADRFYDDEADALENLSAEDKNLAQKICAALGVECDEDLEFTQRIREKKKILAEKTDDQNIIDNAAITALNQDDLANLLHMDYQTIYLCGENFTVPVRVADKKYIGILGTPKIKIKANSDEALAAKNIVFENCQLPWHKAAPIDEMKALASKIFGNDGKWLIIKKPDPYSSNVKTEIASYYENLNRTEKSMAVNMLCQGKYDESKIVYLQVTEDFSDGFALTVDAFCTGGTSGGNIIKFKDINESVSTRHYLSIGTKGGWINFNNAGSIFALDFSEINFQLKKFLDVVKNL